MNRPYRHAGGKAKHETYSPAGRTCGLQTFLAEAVKLPFLRIGKDIVCDRFMVLMVSDDVVVKRSLPDFSSGRIVAQIGLFCSYGFQRTNDF